MDQRGAKRRSRLDEVTFGADGRARDTHAQQARKRRQIVISDDDDDDDASILPSAVKREYVRMLRAAREDIKERGPRDPVEEAIKAAQARVTGYGRRDIELLKRIQSAVRLKACTSELALSVGTCVEIKVRALHAVDATT